MTQIYSLILKAQQIYALKRRRYVLQHKMRTYDAYYLRVKYIYIRYLCIGDIITEINDT